MASKKKRIILIIIAIILAILLALGATYFILYQNGKSQFHKNDKNITASNVEGLEVYDDLVTYNDTDYVLNKNVVSILFLGIDKEKINNNFGYGKNGQADTIFVAAVNTETKKVKIIPVQRETMTEVKAYDKNGKYTGTAKEQICLSYAYGDSAEKSCQNVKESVSHYLMGINIGSYIAMDLSGISDTTKRIGGVSVSAIESVPYYSGYCNVGDSLLLKGESARQYIQYRTEDLEGSSKRLLRQKQFLSAFASTAGNQILNDFTKLTDYYNGIIPYCNTDLSFSQISYLATSCITKDLGNLIEYQSIDGEIKQNDKWAEFYPNEESLVNAILNTFYLKK